MEFIGLMGFIGFIGFMGVMGIMGIVGIRVLEFGVLGVSWFRGLAFRSIAASDRSRQLLF